MHQASIPIPAKAAYSLPEFCELVSLGRTMVDQEIRKGRLRPIKIGRRKLIPAAEVTRWLESLALEARAPKVSGNKRQDAATGVRGSRESQANPPARARVR